MNLEVRGFTAGYGSNPIIFDVNATFRGGDVSAIIGPNGAGKSTLVKAIFGQANLFEGQVLLDDEEVPQIVAAALVERGVAYVPQLANVFASLTVKENLEVGTYVRSGYALEKVFELFPDLKAVLGKHAGKLSGGQRNMLAVARALMSDPGVLLLDEATAGLSPLLSNRLWEHLLLLAKEGIAVVIVEQNVSAALYHADRVLLLTSGRVRVEGPAKELAASGDIDRLFLEASQDVQSGVRISEETDTTEVAVGHDTTSRQA
jgi:ABC-type branched-subunit amino acid transport system ATPase component